MQKKEEENLEELDAKSSQMIITKFLRKGFDGLALEDLAVGLIVPNFAEDFQKQTGANWTTKYEIKALERLNRANFDLHWMARKTKNIYDFLFVNCIKGDVEKVRDFIKKTADENLLYAVDERKRSPLHLAAKEGHTSLVEYLLLKGFNVGARDRILKTPLHYAAQLGHDVVASTLMKNGSPLEAKDNCGRTSFLYACLGSSAQMITLFLATRPEAVKDTDNIGRKALHYAVFNNSSKQIDIIRILLEHKCEINGIDDDGFTCLHLASEGGRVRAIPILLKNGAELGIREKKTHKTALELAANDRTREVLIVYGTVSYQPNEEEKEWMNQAVKGEKLPINKSIDVKKPAVSEKKVGKEDDNNNAMIVFLREQFFELMKKIQETGIQTFQHFKRPYLYTGSWMEGIRTIEELYDRLRDLRPAEAALRTFNILCPYDKPLPLLKGDEKAITAMYGDPWFDLTEVAPNKKVQQPDYEIKEKALQSALDMTRENLKSKDEEIKNLKAEVENCEATITDLKSQLESKNNQIQMSNLNQQAIDTKNEEISKLKRDANGLNRKIKELEIEMVTNKADFTSNLGEFSQLKEQISDLKGQLSRAKTLEKANRFKAGKLFLKALEDFKGQKVVVSDIKNIKAQGGLENLEDDAAIIKLYQSLKNNPPGLITRLKECDSNGDEQLTQVEFTTFCEKLKLKPQDIHSLCRVAGYFDGKQVVGIIEFKSILEQRPKMREKWERFLFKRVYRAIRERNLTIDQVFTLIDVDNDKKVTPKELKMGLEGLKIVLNQHDFNNMFQIFDKDNNQTLDMDEIKNTLLFYEKEAENEEDQQEDFVERIVDKNLDDYEDNKGEQLKMSDLFITDSTAILEGDNIKSNEDFTIFNGDVKIQIPYGKNLRSQKDLKEIVIRSRIRGSYEPEIQKSLLLFEKNKWSFAVKMQIRNSLRENLSDILNIQIFTNTNFKDENSFLGELNLIWKVCLDKPDTWTINNEFALKNTTFPEKDPKNETDRGIIGIQVKYIPSTSKDFKSKLFENESATTIKKNFLAAIKEKGTLEVTIISGILMEKTTNVKCDIKLPGRDVETFPSILDAQRNPLWTKKILQELNLQSDNNVDCIYAKIFQEKPKAVLGEIYVDWEECLRYPLLYLSHKAFLFPLKTTGNEKSNKLYLKIRWIPEAQYNKLTGFSSNYDEKTKKKKIAENIQDLILGTLKVLVVRAKGLVGKDSNIDPYCVLQIEGGEKILEQETKHKSKTQNPEYLEKKTFETKFFKDGPKPPLNLIIKDKNTLKDSIIGKCAVDLAPALDTPCIWAIDSYFPLKNDKEEPVGEIYIQVYYVPKGQNDPNLKPVDKENKASLADEDMISGKIFIRVIHGKDLKPADGKTSDPYCQINFPDNTELKTGIINKTVNPIWNQNLDKTIKILTEKMAPIKFVIKDNDFLKDDLLGMVDVDWKICVEKKGQWAINDIFKVTGTPDVMGNLSSLGYLYIQMRFIQEGQEPDDQIPPLIENLTEILAAKGGIWKGKLKVFLISCSNLLKADSSTDPMVIFKVAGGKQRESEIIKRNINPVWKIIYDIPINMPRNTLQPMRVEVYDHNMMSKQFLGYANIVLEECFNNPGKWAINKIFDLDGNVEQKKKNILEYGNIYLQILYMIEGENKEVKPLPLLNDLDEVHRKQMEEDEKLIQGILKINVVMARKLQIADSDSSDPYCSIILPDNKSTSTKIIEMDLNPIWNFEYPTPISLPAKKCNPIIFKVLDKDTGSRDDDLGQATIDWKDCIDNPGLWRVNGLYDLKGDGKFGQNLGQIYVQMKFMKDAKEEDHEGCPTIKELVKEYGRVIGKLKVDIYSASGLYKSDFFGKSDPFCIAYLSPHPNEHLTTPVQKNTMEPIWNFKEKFLFLDIRSRQIPGLNLVVEIYDEDPASSDLMGSTTINLITFLENPHEMRSSDYPVIRKKNKPSGTVKLGIEWQPDPRCETIENIELLNKLINGEIIIKVLNAKKIKNTGIIGKTTSYVEIYSSVDLKRKNIKKTKPCKENLDPEYNESLSIPILKVNEDDFLASTLICQVIGDRGSIIGGIDIALRPLVEKPGTWLNDYWELIDKQGKIGVGWLSLQVQFKTNDSPNNIEQPTPIKFEEVERKIEEMKPKTIIGELIINVIGARRLKAKDFNGKSDPYCTLQLSDPKIKQTLKTQTIDNNLNPMWNSQDHRFPIDLSKKEFDKLTLYVKVFDYDGVGDDLIGQNQINLKLKVFSLPPGEWFNGFFVLLNEDNAPEGNSEIYLQILWLPKGLQNYQKEVQNLLEKEVKEAEEMEKKRKEELDKIPKRTGQFLINIISAIKLKNSDIGSTSDPYCVCALSKGEKKKIQTKPIDDTLKPEWNFMNQVLDISLPATEYEDLKLFIKVYDYDNPLNSDLLGSAVIDLVQLVHEPGTWFNDFTPLMDEKGVIGSNGLVYLQIQWKEEGFKGKIQGEPEKLQGPKLKPQEPTIKGDFYIKVVGSKNLKNSDGMFEGKSDGYCKVSFSQGKGNRVVTTPEVADDLNPIWNHEDTIKLDYSMTEYKQLKLIAEVLDRDFASSEFLGKIIVDIGYIFETPGTWFNKSLSLMDKDMKSATQGEVYLMAQWRPDDQKIDQTPPEDLYANEISSITEKKKTINTQVEDTEKRKKKTIIANEEEQKKEELKTKDKMKEEVKKEESQVKDSNAKKELTISETKEKVDKSEIKGENESQLIEKNQKNQPLVEPISKKEPPNIPGTKSGTIVVKIISGKLPSMHTFWKGDKICKFKLAKANPQSIDTKPIANVNPTWNYEDKMKLSLPEKEFEDLTATVEAVDYDFKSNTLIGTVEINLGKTIITSPNKAVLNTYGLVDKKNKPVKDAVVTIELTWIPI